MWELVAQQGHQLTFRRAGWRCLQSSDFCGRKTSFKL